MSFRLRFLVVGFAAIVLLNDPGRAEAAEPPPATPPACRDVPEVETHLAVLISPADVLWVDELREGVKLPDGTIPAGDGARIVISARPFTTAAWLQQLIDCHRARDAARGGPPGASRSPLDVPNTSIHVGWAPGYLIVDVISTNDSGGREILARARACGPQTPPRMQAAR
jgi:hypothetical protein